MKQISELIDEFNEISVEIQLNTKRKKGEVGFITRGSIKKLKDRQEYLTTCMNYLRTNPSPEFIKSEKQRLLKRHNLIMEQCELKAENFADQKSFTKAKRNYEKLMDLPKIRLQLKTLNFIS